MKEPVEQVGGTHYAPADKYGHWDYVIDAGIPYLEGNATKYVSRWRDKNGIQDLQKAISYIDKRLTCKEMKYYTGGMTNDPMCGPESNIRHSHPRLVLLDKFYKDAGIGAEERAICTLIFHWETASDLKAAKELILVLIQQAKAEGAAYTNQG